MIANSLRAAAIVASLIAGSAIAGPSDAEAIDTPAGRLWLGMSEDASTKVFKRAVEEQKTSDGIVVNRYLSVASQHQTFSVNLTSKGVVYSIVVAQWYPRSPIGDRSAERVFHKYLRAYGAPDFHPARQQDKSMTEVWTNAYGHQVRVALNGCSNFSVSLQISDHQRELKDDGVSHDDQGQRSVDSWSISNCF